MLPIITILLIMMFPFTGIAEDAQSGYVQVTLEYKSMFPGRIQVRDEVCKESRSIECAMASIKATGETCRQKPQRDECKEARALLETSFCIAGLIYDERSTRGEKITLRLCISDGGYGNMSVRDIEKGSIWTNYPLLSDRQAVSFP